MFGGKPMTVRRAARAVHGVIVAGALVVAGCASGPDETPFADDLFSGELWTRLFHEEPCRLYADAFGATDDGLDPVLGDETAPVAAYWDAIAAAETDARLRAATVLADLLYENAQLDQARLAFDQLIACRRDTAARVHTAVADAALGADEAAADLAEQRTAVDADVATAHAIIAAAARRSDAFDYANRQINPDGAAELARAVKAREGGDAPLTATEGVDAAGEVPTAQVLLATADNQAKVAAFRQAVDGARAEIEAALAPPPPVPAAAS